MKKCRLLLWAALFLSAGIGTAWAQNPIRPFVNVPLSFSMSALAVLNFTSAPLSEAEAFAFLENEPVQKVQKVQFLNIENSNFSFALPRPREKDAAKYIKANRQVVKDAGAEASIDYRLVAGVLWDELLRRGVEDDIQDSQLQIYVDLLANSNQLGLDKQQELEIAKYSVEKWGRENDINTTSFGLSQMTPDTLRHLNSVFPIVYQGKTLQNSDDLRVYQILLDKEFAPYLIAWRLQQIQSYWKKNGVDLSNRMEILATLYSMGLTGSKGVHENAKSSQRGQEIVDVFMERVEEIID